MPTNTARVRAGPPSTSHLLRRAAGVSLATAGLVYLVAEAVTARGWVTPRYSYVHNYVSDLGAPICGTWSGRPVCSPLHTIMNIGFVLDGAFFLLGAILAVGLAGKSGTRLFVGLAVAHSLGLTLVGGVPSTTPEPAGHLHTLGAVLAIVCGNLAVIVGGRAVSGSGTPRWLPVASVALGTCGIMAFALLIGRPVVPPGLLAGLGEGLVERLSIYTITAWEILAGALLMAAPVSLTPRVVRWMSAARG